MEQLSESAKNRITQLVPGFSAHGFTLGKPSVNPGVLLASTSAILLKYSEDFYYLVATYEFNPTNPDFSSIADVFVKTKVIILKHSLKNDPQTSYKSTPEWLGMFKGAHAVILDSVDLSDVKPLLLLNLRLLGVLQGTVTDHRGLVEALRSMKDLEFLTYKSVFTSDDVEKLKERNPQLTVIRQ